MHFHKPILVHYRSVFDKVGPNGEAQFVPGAIIDLGQDDSRFFPGQLIGGLTPEEVTFIPGLRGVREDGKKVFVPGQIIKDQFIPGQMMEIGPGNSVFVPGDVVVNAKDGTEEFVPGIYEVSTDGKGEVFTPGLTLDSPDGPVFVEGKMVMQKDSSISGGAVDPESLLMFVPTKSGEAGGDPNSLEKAANAAS